MALIVSATGARPLSAELRDSLQLRAMRAAPPGLAARGERRKVFSSSLEQSEQLLSAAALTPPEARPMLIFYGLAQGCRALLACAPTVPDAQFRTKGHGLREKHLRGRIEDVSIEATHSGMFGGLCRLLGFTEFQAPVTFAQLWAINPHLFQRPLAGSLQPPCVTTNCGLDLTVLSELAVLHLGFLSTDQGERLSTPAEVAEFVRSNYGPFPFDILELDPRSGYTDRYFRETWTDLNVHVPRSQFEVAEAHIEARTATVGYNTWMLPQVGGVTSRPNALILWWALLFSLSLRARYEPEGWTKDLDPDSSAIAVQLEDLLDDAPARCHALLLEAIKAVCVSDAN